MKFIKNLIKKLIIATSFVISSVACANNSVNCMSTLIYAETQGAPIDAKRAVAQVTMNRVHSDKFPNSVCGVAYQKYRGVYQYSWAGRPVKIKNMKEYEEARKVAHESLSGKIVHPKVYATKAMFFHARSINPRWKYRRVYSDGHHHFYAYNNNGKHTAKKS